MRTREVTVPTRPGIRFPMEPRPRERGAVGCALLFCFALVPSATFAQADQECDRIDRLREQVTEMSERYPPKHPDLMAAEKALQQLSADIAAKHPGKSIDEICPASTPTEP